MATKLTGREIQLVARPRGIPTPADFRMATVEVREPAADEVVVRNLFMSVDPYMRGRMNEGRSHAPPFRVGEALDGGSVGEVLASRSPALSVGDLVVSGRGGWREYHVASASEYERLDAPVSPLSIYLGALGMPGLTAYVGVLDIAKVKAGETVFVSGAAGAVGGMAGQIAKALGCRVVGSAGSPEKAAGVVRELGFDAAFDYRQEPPRPALERLCPEGVDVYFDNVGGEHLEAALAAMKRSGRIVACGAISSYCATAPTPGPRNLSLVIGKRLSMQGFIVSDHLDRMPAFRADVGRRLAEGKLKARETVANGIQEAPAAFISMLQGGNVGKMIVKLA
jgi:NADPH-dependent curcumin reductase CurA